MHIAPYGFKFGCAIAAASAKAIIRCGRDLSPYDSINHATSICFNYHVAKKSHNGKEDCIEVHTKISVFSISYGAQRHGYDL